MILDLCGDKVTITVPDDYPEGEFYVDCDVHPSLRFDRQFLVLSNQFIDINCRSEKVNDYCMGKTISATILFQFIADKIVEMDLLGTGNDDDGSDDFGCVADGDHDDGIDPYEIKVESMLFFFLSILTIIQFFSEKIERHYYFACLLILFRD